jgi:hypothetical protein
LKPADGWAAADGQVPRNHCSFKKAEETSS